MSSPPGLSLPSLDGLELYQSGEHQLCEQETSTQEVIEEETVRFEVMEEESIPVEAKGTERKVGHAPSTMLGAEALDVLRQSLEVFKLNRRTLSKCYEETNTQLAQLRKGLSLSDDAVASFVFMSDSDKAALGQALKKDPVILVVGQTNCGKTSLINQILQKSYLPTSEYPCTARLVRTKFSETKYIHIKDSRGITLETVAVDEKFKRVPRKYIVLEGEERETKNVVEQIVEVGLDDPLLSCGVEIIDAPGTCENEALDGIVKECLDGILQVVLYVIDGNESLKRTDISFLYRLRATASRMKVIFVCNKVEEDKRANVYDLPSDDSDDTDSDEANEDFNRSDLSRDKGFLAFQRLQRADLIPKEESKDTCPDFHSISCKQVRIARHRHEKPEKNRYLKNFQRLLSSLIDHFTECVNKHLLLATSRLLAIQKRTFDFFIADKFLKVPQIEQLPNVIRKILYEERDHYAEMKRHLDQQEEEMINVISKYLHGSYERDRILDSAGNISFSPIKIGDEVQRNYVINECRKQVRDFVLMKVTADIENKIHRIKESISQKFQQSFELSIMKLPVIGPITNILQEQLDKNYMTFSSSTPVELAVESGVMKEDIATKAANVYENVKATMGGIYLDEHWKRDTARAVFKSIDSRKLAASICGGIRTQMKKGHESFTFAMNQINGLYSLRQKQTYTEQKKLLQQVPKYAVNICETEALYSTLEHGPIKLQKEVGNGERSILYTCCRDNAGRTPTGNVIAKVFKQTQIPEDFATIYNYLRLLPKADHFLRPNGVGFTCEEKFTVLLPRIDTNLYQELTGANPLCRRFNIAQRLQLAAQIASACDHASSNGFRLSDLRPSNIMLLYRQGEPLPTVKVHVVKWKVEDQPYPDGLPPFHFAPEAYKSFQSAKSVKVSNAKFDSYSVAILTWMLAIGKFVRPNFAKTDCDSVKSYVMDNVGEIGDSILLQMVYDHGDAELKENQQVMDFIREMLGRFVVSVDQRYDMHTLHNMLKKHLGQQGLGQQGLESRETTL